ncbi:50S ribosomal protein L18 [Candidatus Omnitrophota bacterium]
MRFREWIKLKGRKKRHCRIRNKISGTKDTPRACVFRSLKNLSVQLVDDLSGHTLYSISTCAGEVKDRVKNTGNVEAARALGEAFAKNVREKGFEKVIFDRAGYRYHGRIKAFVEAARKGGIKL